MLNWPEFYFRPVNLWSIGMAGSHLTDNEWLQREKAKLSDEEADRFEEAVDVSTTRLGLEKARRAALERVMRMRERG
jgi:hypothetical protein